MKRQLFYQFSLGVVLLLSVFTISCNKENAAPAPTIISFTPDHGSEGTIVTISGANFSTTPAGNTVMFNGTVAVVTASTSTSITTAVPNGATTGPVMVTANGVTATSSALFTIVQLPAPTVTSFSPISGMVGTTITVTGNNFDAIPTNNIVKFNGTTAIVTASTATSIITSVPAGATSGTIAITVNGQTATSSSLFTVHQVFAAGFEVNGTTYAAKIWKNGVATTLSDGTHEAQATSVYVSGADVYVSGYEYISSFIRKAKIWKNGVATALTDGTYDAAANSVFVNGTDVYVGGFERNSSNFLVAKIWKNGVATSLTDGTKYGQVFSVLVSGADIYAAGVETNSSILSIAKVWKNGFATDISDGTNNALVVSLKVSGTDVYAVGGEGSASHQSIAKIWKNGVATNLTDGTLWAFANSVFISGPDVFVAGNEYNSSGYGIAKIWKNGAPLFSDGTYDNQLTSVFVSGTDIFAAGSKDNQDGKSTQMAEIWYNGVGFSLTDGTHAARINSIFVVSQ